MIFSGNNVTASRYWELTDECQPIRKKNDVWMYNKYICCEKVLAWQNQVNFGSKYFQNYWCKECTSNSTKAIQNSLTLIGNKCWTMLKRTEPTSISSTSNNLPDSRHVIAILFRLVFEGNDPYQNATPLACELEEIYTYGHKNTSSMDCLNATTH